MAMNTATSQFLLSGIKEGRMLGKTPLLQETFTIARMASHASSLIAISQISLMRVFSGQVMSKRVQFKPPSVEWKTSRSQAA